MINDIKLFLNNRYEYDWNNVFEYFLNHNFFELIPKEYFDNLDDGGKIYEILESYELITNYRLSGLFFMFNHPDNDSIFRNLKNAGCLTHDKNNILRYNIVETFELFLKDFNGNYCKIDFLDIDDTPFKIYEKDFIIRVTEPKMSGYQNTRIYNNVGLSDIIVGRTLNNLRELKNVKN